LAVPGKSSSFDATALTHSSAGCDEIRSQRRDLEPRDPHVDGVLARLGCLSQVDSIRIGRLRRQEQDTGDLVRGFPRPRGVGETRICPQYFPLALGSIIIRRPGANSESIATHRR